MSLDEALNVVRAAGYRVSKPKPKPKPKPRQSDTVNPFGHAFPHARLRNITLTSIERLSKNNDAVSRHLIENDDARNWQLHGGKRP